MDDHLVQFLFQLPILLLVLLVLLLPGSLLLLLFTLCALEMFKPSKQDSNKETDENVMKTQEIDKGDIPSMAAILQDPGLLSLREKHIRLKQKDIHQTIEYINNQILQGIIDYINHQDQLFKWARLDVGSYYEKLKILRPDEFDITVKATNKAGQDALEGLEIDCQIGSSGFCGIRTNKKEGLRGMLIEYGSHYYISLKKFKERFYMQLKEAIDDLDLSQSCRIVTEKQDSLSDVSPAIKVKVERAYKWSIAIDLVPALVIPWPEDIQWESIWAKRTVYEGHRGYLHAVAKTHLSERKVPPEGAILWRMSFSNIEKLLIYHADGTANKKAKKGEYVFQRPLVTFRKPFMKLMKSFLECEINNAFKQKGIEEEHRTFCSYHLKTLALNIFNSPEYENASAWRPKKILRDRLRECLIRLKQCVQRKELFHHFIPSINLLSELSLMEQNIIIQQIDLALREH